MNTEYLKIGDISKDRPLIEKAGETLRNGGVVAIPTETVYGLAANALDETAVKKIFAAKGRPADNPLIVHVSGAEDVAALVERIDPRFPALAEKFWPGPLTVIMKKSALVPDVTSGGLDTVAVRCPSHPVAHAIIEAAGVPLAAPSANISGKPSPTKAEHVLADMQGRIDMIADGGSCEIGVESTVITLAENPPRLLRPGGVTPGMLKELLPDLVTDKSVFSALEKGAKAASPGMKYKHYSPSAEVVLLKGTLENAVKYVNKHGGEGCAVLCYEGEAQKFNVPAFEYGRENDMLSLAHGVFDALRKLDSGFTRAYVRTPEPEGVGLAVYNRLLRSAAFRVADADNPIEVIGLTGPTGAGKSTVSKYFKDNGYYIIDGDLLAREAVKSGTVLRALAEEYGADIINEDGSLDRRKTADRAFASPEKTKRLNEITHPAICALTSMEIAKAQSENARGAVIDAAALLECPPILALCDKLACVIAPAEERLQRITVRDSITEEQAKRRISAQHPDDYYISRTDYTIHNGINDDFRPDADKVIAGERNK